MADNWIAFGPVHSLGYAITLFGLPLYLYIRSPPVPKGDPTGHKLPVTIDASVEIWRTPRTLEFVAETLSLSI